MAEALGDDSSKPWERTCRLRGSRLKSLSIRRRNSLKSPPHRLSISTHARENASRLRFARISSRQTKLIWNQALTGRKFGHYGRSTDTVMLSVSLDSPAVPEFVLDFVMYHELLHKKHGIPVVNERRVVHSAAFRAEERKSADYHEADRVLNELARRH
jgi:hypothetical protein